MSEIFQNPNEGFPRAIELTTRTSGEYLAIFDARGIHIRDWTKDNMLLTLTPLEKKESISLVARSISDLGLRDGVTLKEIYAKALEFRLGLCDPHVGPETRLAFIDQQANSHYHIAMEPVIKSDNRKVVWDIAHTSDGLWLDRRGGDTNSLWRAEDVFIFTSHK